MISIFRSAAEKNLSVQQLIDGQEMLVLVLVLVVVLQFEGTRGEIHLYHREGENVVLPCNSPSSDYSCSVIDWVYYKDTSSAHTVIGNGKVDQSSPRASRLNLDNICSLIINNITADDAGIYICTPGSRSSSDGLVYLNVLTISDADPTNEDFTLQCSLWKHGGWTSCPQKSFRWFDETGSELTSKNDDRRSTQRCFSSLTVKHQSDTNRRFTCQFVERNKIKIEVQYTQVHLYHRAGDEAVLPCNRPSSSDSCSSVDWIYQRNKNMNRKQEVHKGMVQSSPRSARMSLDRNCSLIINNIMAEDVGRYSCGYNTDVYLNMMIISSSPPDVDPTKNEEITLFCSLLRSRSSGFCPDKSFLWLDETGSELTGEGDGYKYGGQFGCVSSLTVNLQSSRRFTCQFVEGNKVKIEAHYGSEGTRGEKLHLYHRGGENVVLPCNSPESFDSCSIINWLYNRDRSKTHSVFINGKVVQSSPRASRLNLDNSCSLIINNITADDAGFYICRPGPGISSDGFVFLNVLTISPSPTDADPTKEDFTLLCSLSSRRFTCQFVEGNKVKIEAHYGSEGPPASSPLSFIMLTLKITGLILIVGITVGIIRTRGRKKPQKDVNVRFSVDDDSVNYENDGERSAAAALH
ncbi:uncharacterized protein LOC122825666 isoform X2 [Gambusia affinis]|uniref:uncharacterized protein LOC122825666 isoform X2 n=1 Tax=Gambusia affinis TaxID=33528 RepID=UPI001CDCF4EF|nr:uncharacterized protein LOC122825666 isoform X2 [Gambusia affinis]